MKLEKEVLIILTVLLTGLNIIVLEGIFNVLTPSMVTFSFLGYLEILPVIILILVSIFINIAVIGMTRKILLNEIAILKTGWKTGKKYFLKILLLAAISMGVIVLLTLILGIIAVISLTLLQINISQDLIFMGIIMLIIGICALVGLFLIFASQAVIIGEKGVIKAIKQSIQLVRNNKIKAIIPLISMMLISLIGFIPIIGSILSSIITPILSISYNSHNTSIHRHNTIKKCLETLNNFSFFYNEWIIK